MSFSVVVTAAVAQGFMDCVHIPAICPASRTASALCILIFIFPCLEVSNEVGNQKMIPRHVASQHFRNLKWYASCLEIVEISDVQ